MSRYNSTEELLFKKGYWKLSKGNEHDMPLVNSTPKWNKLIQTLGNSNPVKLITEKQVIEYVNSND